MCTMSTLPKYGDSLKIYDNDEKWVFEEEIYAYRLGKRGDFYSKTKSNFFISRCREWKEIYHSNNISIFSSSQSHVANVVDGFGRIGEACWPNGFYRCPVLKLAGDIGGHATIKQKHGHVLTLYYLFFFSLMYFFYFYPYVCFVLCPI